MATPRNENPELDMTPMIDVVFELIIFFVVTLKVAAEKDESIRLEDGQRGDVIVPEDLPPQTMTIDVAEDGTISICNWKVGKEYITRMVKDRVRKYGMDNVPVMIRADWRARHRDVKTVMDACTEGGIWKVSFLAVGERKSGKKKTERITVDRKNMRVLR